jgi:hypothetical protein
MNLSDLPVEDRELVLALIEIASVDCKELHWSDLEPILSACWNETSRRGPALSWGEIAPYVRAACGETEAATLREPHGQPAESQCRPSQTFRARTQP